MTEENHRLTGEMLEGGGDGGGSKKEIFNAMENKYDFIAVYNIILWDPHTHDYMCKKTVRRPYMFVLEL